MKNSSAARRTAALDELRRERLEAEKEKAHATRKAASIAAASIYGTSGSSFTTGPAMAVEFKRLVEEMAYKHEEAGARTHKLIEEYYEEPTPLERYARDRKEITRKKRLEAIATEFDPEKTKELLKKMRETQLKNLGE